jgi:hypothetical protein
MINDVNEENQHPVGHGSKYDRLSDAAISALLTARTEEEAARQAGISRKTLWKWKQLPKFLAAWHARKQEIVNAQDAKYLAALPAASSAAMKILVDTNASPAVRLRAAAHVENRAEKSMEKSARAIEAAKAAHRERRAKNEERRNSANAQVLNLMGEDGRRYVALIRKAYAQGELTDEEHVELLAHNIQFVQVWRNLELPFSLLEPHRPVVKIRRATGKLATMTQMMLRQSFAKALKRRLD